MPRRPLDLTHRQFDSLRALEDVGADDLSRARLWLCECECGEQRVVRASDLKGRRVRSCSDQECIDKLNIPKPRDSKMTTTTDTTELSRDVDFALQRFLDDLRAEKRRTRDETSLNKIVGVDPDDYDDQLELVISSRPETGAHRPGAAHE